MPEQKDVWKSTIRYKGKFDFQGLYEFVNGWFKDRGYNPKETKFKQVDSAGKYEIEMKIEAERATNPDFKNLIVIEIKAYALEKISTVPSYAKESDGRVELFIKGTSIFDWAKRFEKGMKKTYGKVYKFIADAKDRSAEDDSREVDGAIRNFLNMKLDNK